MLSNAKIVTSGALGHDALMDLGAQNVEEPNVGIVERRQTSRFPFEAEVKYKLTRGKVVTSGAGKTLNMGSRGVLFTTEHRLPLGQTVEVAVNWPALLDGTCPLKLVASGPVIRAEDGVAAIRLSRYEFRTRASH